MGKVKENQEKQLMQKALAYHQLTDVQLGPVQQQPWQSPSSIHPFQFLLLSTMLHSMDASLRSDCISCPSCDPSQVVRHPQQALRSSAGFLLGANITETTPGPGALGCAPHQAVSLRQGRGRHQQHGKSSLCAKQRQLCND